MAMVQVSFAWRLKSPLRPRETAGSHSLGLSMHGSPLTPALDRRHSTDIVTSVFLANIYQCYAKMKLDISDTSTTEVGEALAAVGVSEEVQHIFKGDYKY